MNEINSQAEQLGQLTYYQPEFEAAINDEKLRCVWKNLDSIRAGLKIIEEGLLVADEYNRITRGYLEKLQRPEPEDLPDEG